MYSDSKAYLPFIELKKQHLRNFCRHAVFFTFHKLINLRADTLTLHKFFLKLKNEWP